MTDLMLKLQRGICVTHPISVYATCKDIFIQFQVGADASDQYVLV